MVRTDIWDDDRIGRPASHITDVHRYVYIDVVLPEDKYNAYMEFRKAVFFFSNSADIPTSNELFGILQDGITAKYLINVVRTQLKTPFANVEEGFLAFRG
jgi:hypothetical protein